METEQLLGLMLIPQGLVECTSTKTCILVTAFSSIQQGVRYCFLSGIVSLKKNGNEPVLRLRDPPPCLG